MSIISVTERQLFKRCRRRWDYSSFSRQSLSPVVNAPALDLGTLIHSTLAEWTADPSLSPLEIYEQHMTTLLKYTIDSYTQRIGCKPSQTELAPLLEAFNLGFSMIKNYHEYWHTPLPPGYTLIQNEQTVTTNIPGTCIYANEAADVCLCDLCECYSPDDCIDDYVCQCCCHQLEATFDGVMADEHGQLFIIERKTYSRRPSIEELDRKDQFIAYMWALQRTFPNQFVVGVSYDGLWKRDKPPAGKQLSDLFLRRNLLRNQHELQEFEQELSLEALDMCDPNVRIYKHEPVLGGCWDCNFRPLCDAQSRNVNYNDVRKMYQVINRKEWRSTRDEEMSIAP